MWSRSCSKLGAGPPRAGRRRPPSPRACGPTPFRRRGRTHRAPRDGSAPLLCSSPRFLGALPALRLAESAAFQTPRPGQCRYQSFTFTSSCLGMTVSARRHADESFTVSRCTPDVAALSARAWSGAATLAAVADGAAGGAGALAAVTVPVPADLDLSAAVLARPAARRPLRLPRTARSRRLRARRARQAATIEASGPGRFADVAARAREFGAGGASPTTPRRTRSARPPPGPVFVGGFAFAHDGGALAGVVLAGAGLACAPGARARAAGRRGTDDPQCCRSARRRRRGGGRAAAASRASELAPAAMPLLDPDPVRAHPRGERGPALALRARRGARRGAHPRRRAREGRARAGGARPRAAPPHDPAAVFGALRELFPACYCWCVGTPEAAFVGASPELLVRRDGQRAQTVALAGTTRRSADPPWTTTWASSSSRARRTARSRRSWRAASSARSTR